MLATGLLTQTNRQCKQYVIVW